MQLTVLASYNELNKHETIPADICSHYHACATRADGSGQRAAGRSNHTKVRPYNHNNNNNKSRSNKPNIYHTRTIS